ncbi:MAG: hypothetical protein LBQ27_04475 [Clostridiales bacterium]|jgi:transposase-like protein|nr:hypothetical protein [Clostridiales bacterium]
MKTAKEIETRKCPYCGAVHDQIRAGRNRCGTQRCRCLLCKRYYTLNPKPHCYAEEVQKQAIGLLISGMSGRQVGIQLGMSKANVYKWVKKTGVGVDKSAH